MEDAQAGSYPGLPPRQDCLLNRLYLQGARRGRAPGFFVTHRCTVRCDTPSTAVTLRVEPRCAFRYDSPGRDDRSNWSLNQEWVDVTNSTRRAVNLDGWTLRDEDGHTFTFRHVRLDGRSTVRVHTGVGRDSRTDLFQDRRAYVWNNDYDTATLRDDRGRFIDDVSWRRQHRGHRH
ncbi:lamin tail domain-containing protein [Streptomyces sp. NPDC002250]|uniref:lamin tail domain-containing protein n=1 Tax=Streptomyces sp. NPDC002250 TaxID=3364641 RepID=UPI0036C2D28E